HVVARHEQVTRRGVHARLPTAGSHLHTENQPVQEIRFHARPARRVGRGKRAGRGRAVDVAPSSGNPAGSGRGRGQLAEAVPPSAWASRRTRSRSSRVTARSDGSRRKSRISPPGTESGTFSIQKPRLPIRNAFAAPAFEPSSQTNTSSRTPSPDADGATNVPNVITADANRT